MKNKKFILLLSFFAITIVLLLVFNLLNSNNIIKLKGDITLLENETMFLDGKSINNKMKEIATTSEASGAGNVKTFRKGSSISSVPSNAEIVSTSSSSKPIYMWYDSNTIYWFSEAQTVYLNPDSKSFFQAMVSLENMMDLNQFNTSKVTNMHAMFDECWALKNLDVSFFDTSNVTDMSYMFSHCYNLETVNVSNFNTSNVEDFSVMFFDCYKLKSLDLSSFDMSSGTDFSSFIVQSDIISSMVTPKKYPSNSDFSIPLRTRFYDQNKNYYTEINSQTPKQMSIVTSSQFLKGNDFNKKLKKLADGGDISNLDENTSIIHFKRSLTLDITPTEENIISMEDSHSIIYAWFDNGTIFWYTDALIPELNYDSRGMFYNMNKLETIDELNQISSYKLGLTTGMFSYCYNLKLLDFSSLDFSNVDESSMFYDCNSLEKIKTPKNISERTDIDLPSTFYDNDNNKYVKINIQMPTETWISIPTVFAEGETFNYKIKRLAGNEIESYSSADENIINIRRSETLNITPTEENIVSANNSSSPIYAWFDNGTIYWFSDSSKIFLNQDSSHMFMHLSKLEHIYNLDIIDTSDVKSMLYLFNGDKELRELDLTHFDTGNVTDMRNMFYNCEKLTSLDLSSFNTSNVREMSDMFSYCKGLTSLDLSNFNTTKVVYMSYLFRNCSGLTSLDLSSFNTEKVQYMNSLFEGCTNLSNINISSFNTSLVVEMDSMFRNCSSLTNIDLSHFDTSKVTKMNSMFSGCTLLTSLNISSFETPSLISTASMFAGCASITSLDLTHFDTNKVQYMNSMFDGCVALSTLNISNFNTSLTTNFYMMFANCTSLTSLDLTNFNTSTANNMVSMFENCTSLTSIDLRSFDTSTVVYMNSMFKNCTSLENVFVGDNFITDNVTDSYSMFYGDINIVGGNGTTFDSNFTDKTYAKADLPNSPGYFKGKVIITFVPNNGIISEDTRIIDYGTVIGTLPVPTRQYYIFKGWFTSLEYTEQVNMDTPLFVSTTLYAKWEEDPQVNIIDTTNVINEEDKFIIKIPTGIKLTKNNLLEMLRIPSIYNIVDKNNNEITAINQGVGTNSKLVSENRTYTIIVKGDINGDGELSIIDLINIYSYMNTIDRGIQTTLNQNQIMACDFIRDNMVDILDLINVYSVMKSND